MRNEIYVSPERFFLKNNINATDHSLEDKTSPACQKM